MVGKEHHRHSHHPHNKMTPIAALHGTSTFSRSKRGDPVPHRNRPRYDAGVVCDLQHSLLHKKLSVMLLYQ